MYNACGRGRRKKQKCFLIVLKIHIKLKKRNNTKLRQTNAEENDWRENLPLVVKNQRSPLYYCLTVNVKTLLAVTFNRMTSLLYDQLRK